MKLFCKSIRQDAKFCVRAELDIYSIPAASDCNQPVHLSSPFLFNHLQVHLPDVPQIR